MHFIITILGHLVAMIIARILFMVVAAFIFLLIVTRLFAQEPGDFLYVTDLEFDNVGGSTSTRMLPVPVNLLNYVNSLLIRGDGTDRIFTDTNDAVVSGFVQNMTINAANVWVYVTSSPSTIVTQKMFHGGSDADQGFPIVGVNLDGTGAAAGGHFALRATSSAPIEIGNLLDVRVDISAQIPCGTIINKIGNNIENPDGWGLYAVGAVAAIVRTTGGGSAGNTSVYMEFTPLNGDVWLCSVGSIQTFTDWLKTTAHGIRVIDVDSGATVCETQDDPTMATFVGLLAGIQQQILLNSPCLVRQNQHVRVFVSGLDMGDSNNGFAGATSSDSNIFIEWNAGCSGACNISGAGPWRSSASAPANITYVLDSLLGTSTGARIGAMVDDTWSFGNNASWDGERITAQIDYTDPDFDVLIDAVVAFTITEAGGIATSTGDLEIGKGFGLGTIFNLEMDAGAANILDFDFDGDDISESVQGNSGNSWQWLGNIDNEGSASAIDLQYILTADTTNINASVSGFGDNPTPTPTAGQIGTSTALLGLPSINPFFTPVPTPAGGLIMGNLKTGATASTLPVEAWWMLLSIIILAVALGIVHKFFPNKPIIAALSVFGIAIVSLAVGEDFRMWIVAIYAVWAFGSTGLYILWAR